MLSNASEEQGRLLKHLCDYILGSCCTQAHSCLEAIRNGISISLCVETHRAHSWVSQSCVCVLQLLIDKDMQLKLLQEQGVQSYFP